MFEYWGVKKMEEVMVDFKDSGLDWCGHVPVIKLAGFIFNIWRLRDLELFK